MKLFRTVLLFLLTSITIISCSNNRDIDEAKLVISRYLDSDDSSRVIIKHVEKKGPNDHYSYSAKDNKISITGSSGVAICKGFYDYMKSQEFGMVSWSGSSLDIPDTIADLERVTVTSPVKHHYNFNAVTFGYTTPYWNWSRWSQEIDWMALHGLDMPMTLVAQEAITLRVFKKLGLTEEEIQSQFTGPAHLPWMRMGNISEIDSELPLSWHKDQVELQHKILDRAKGLGMKPICPGFSGFVPKSLARIYPEEDILETSWGGSFHNWMISPKSDLFKEIGTLFIQEWEKEFGKCNYYLIDSFNEMEIPFPPKDSEERYKLLNSYGESVYNSIKEANPNASWVMMGWMFGYQRYIWDIKTLGALVEKVPDDKIILLDMAVDYNKTFWKNGYNWDFYKGFYNKGWIYSVIPNMGGKVGTTGVLEFYANGHLSALESDNRGNLIGVGMAPEGIENNEVLYELVTDAGWKSSKTDLTKWLANYSVNRYGSSTSEISEAWQLLTKSIYGTFTDHPRFMWQLRPGTVRQGTINIDENLFRGIESFINAKDDINKGSEQHQQLYKNDAIEFASIYLGAELELIGTEILDRINSGSSDKTEELEDEFIKIAYAIDNLLNCHPIYRLERWLDFAKGHGDSSDEAKFYEKNARRIVTVWGPPVDDYACRIWSGLIRDYYIPRWESFFSNQRGDSKIDLTKQELAWVESNTISKPNKIEDPIQYATDIMQYAKSVTALYGLTKDSQIITGWSLSKELKREVQITVSAEKLRSSNSITLTDTKGRSIVTNIYVTADGIRYPIEPISSEDGVTIYSVKELHNISANNQCQLSFTVESSSSAIGVAEWQ